MSHHAAAAVGAPRTCTPKPSTQPTLKRHANYADVDLSKLDLGENPESLVISEVEGDDGTAQVVYRSGGSVSIGELEALCERVGWPPRPAEKVKGALENSFLVRLPPIKALSTMAC